MRITNGKDLTILSLLWLGAAIYNVYTGGDALLTILCVVLIELSKIDTGMHSLGRQVIGIAIKDDDDDS